MAKTTVPENFSISPELRAWARQSVPQVDIDAQHEIFMDYWRAHGKKMADWNATWRNWMRRSPEFTRPVTQHSQVERRPTRPAVCRHGLHPAMCIYCRNESRGARQ